MKTISLWLVCMIIIWVPTRAQEGSANASSNGSITSQNNIVEVINLENGVIIKLGDNELLQITETDGNVDIMVNDSNIFKVSNNEKGIKIKAGNSEISQIISNSDSLKFNNSSEKLDSIINEINSAFCKELNSELQNAQNATIDIIIENSGIELLADNIDDIKVSSDNKDTHIYINKDNKLLTGQAAQQADTTRIKFGKKGFAVIEDESGTTLKIEDMDENDTADFDFDHMECPKKAKFKGHYAGFEMGMNNLLDKDFNISRNSNEEFMDLNTGKSWNVNLNFINYSLGFGSDHIGLVTGIGMEMSNYRFDNNNSLYDSAGYVRPLYPSNGIEYSKSKLLTNFLTVPLLIEWQILDKPRNKRIFISAGIIGSLKIKSQTKEVYKEGGSEQKDKGRDDFSINPLRYGYTVRIGYGSLSAWGTYYPVALFEANKGPELYPFSVGLGLYL